MQNHPGPAVGAIANGHIFTPGAGWVRLNYRVDRAAPKRPGDVIDGQAFTGYGWVPLPGAWLPDPTGRHQVRWWNGTVWTHHAQTNGLPVNDPLVPAAPAPVRAMPVHPMPVHPMPVHPMPVHPMPVHPMPVHPMPVRALPIYPLAPARPTLGFWGVVDRVAVGLYCGFWLLVALYSATIAAQENDPKYLALTATASMNIFLYKLTGKTRSELRKGFIAAVKPKVPYLACGAVAAGGIWLSLHFDDPDILGLTAALVLIGLVFAWALG